MTDKHEERGSHFWVAVGFIAVGFMFLLDNFGIFGFGDIWALWPVIFIVVGIFKLREAKNSHDKNSAYMFIGFGTLFTLLMTDILDWGDIWALWPLILILVGLSMIYRRSKWGGAGVERGQEHSGNRLDVVAIFGGHHKLINSKNFEGGHVTAIFGGAELDFGTSKLAEGENIIDLLTLFGGTELRIPKDWNVQFRGVPVFGGFEDKRREVPEEDRDADRSLIVKGVVLFGGLVVKNA